MAIRTVRLGDLSALRLLDGAENATIVAPSPLDEPTTAVGLVLTSTWRGLHRASYSLILRTPEGPLGFIQGKMRPNREAWDIVRLACLADPDDTLDGACASLIEQFCQATGSHGSLRTFARVPTSGPALRVLSRAGFRQYTTEYTLVRPPLDEQSPGLVAGSEPTLHAATAMEGVRSRRADDAAWSLFVHLYCAVTPQAVRHAEGRSSKDWHLSHQLLRRLLGRWIVADELVMERQGTLVGWLRVHPARSGSYEQLDILVRPDVGRDIAGFVRCGLVLAGPRAAIQPLVCRVRQYDVEVVHALEECGFRIVSEEALLVKHSTVRVTERQLLIAALRAQGLARTDLSHYQGTPGELQAATRPASHSTATSYITAVPTPHDRGAPPGEHYSGAANAPWPHKGLA